MMKRAILLLACVAVTAAAVFWAVDGTAAVSRVRCVVWQGDPAKYHTALSGQATQLKGVIDTTSTSTIYYQWDFGDGTSSAVQALSGKTRYEVEVTHTYTAAVGTPFTAKLRVDAVDASMANAVEDIYLLKIEENSLDARVNIAIDRGLWFLYKTRQTPTWAYSLTGEPVVLWTSYSSYYASPTASAVLAFEINNHKETGNDNEDPYVEAVTRGLNWLFTGYAYNTNYPMLQAVNINVQTYGNPDTNGNGRGIQVRDYSSNPAYEGGMIMDAIVATGTPNASTGRDFDGDGAADTYGKVLQDMVDMYAWGQYDDATVGGGWRYSWNSLPDNSACQWAAIGMIPAQDPPWNCIVPQWVKDRNNVWLTYSYNPTYKWFGYTGTGAGNNSSQATRPSGMVQMVMSVLNYKWDTRWINTEGWFATASNWTWFMLNRTYYGWYAFVKAMRLSNTETLSNGFNWYRGTNGIAEKLLAEQEADGSWPAGGQTTHPHDYGDTFVTAWAIGMLKPALFAAAPIACFTAKPNPSYADSPITFDPSCSGHSETGKDIANLTLFEWDWDHDGVYDQSTTSPQTVTHAFSCASLPCTYPVTLRVTDDSTPALTATYVVNVVISNPPHPPVADANGPYMVSLCSNDSLLLKGTGSYDPNEGKHEDGCTTCEDDTITAWDWDLVPPLTQFTDKTGASVTLSAADVATYFPAGSHTVGLRVTDNTAKSFPNSGQGNLTDTDFADVSSYTGCVCNLAARPKSGKIQITWTHTGASSYDVYRSTTGPNSGFVLVADNVVTTYATYLDTNVVNGTKYYYRVVTSDGCGSNVASATPTTR
uniref:PKD domain-containing protein n=1 Tax=Desulfacinum infernum TaxID=35837 RepID=A0A831ZIY3_9BACT